MSAITVTRGSDSEFTFVFSDTAGDPIPLEVGTAVILDAPASIESRLTPVVTDGPAGVVVVALEGTIPIRVATYRFRVQVKKTDGKSIATTRIALWVV